MEVFTEMLTLNNLQWSGDTTTESATFYVLSNRKPRRDGYVPGGFDQLFCATRR